MKTKTFDCVEMKRQGARRIYEALKGKTLDEQLAYWRQRTEAMRLRRQQGELVESRE